MTLLDPTPYVDVLRAELTQARHAAGLTQYELAPKIGCTQGTLSAWEFGRFMPGLDSLVCWADALGFDVALIPRADTKADRIAEINSQLEAFFAEPPEVQHDVILYLKYNKPHIYHRLQEFLKGSNVD